MGQGSPEEVACRRLSRPASVLNGSPRVVAACALWLFVIIATPSVPVWAQETFERALIEGANPDVAAREDTRTSDLQAGVPGQSSFDGVLRVVWGGKNARQFAGFLAMDEGSLQAIQNLSLQPDAAGTIRNVSDSELKIAAHSASTFGGVDLRIQASLDNELSYELMDPAGKPSLEQVSKQASRPSIRLRDLLAQTQVFDLDEQGARIAFERPISDRIRISTQRQGPPIVSTGERFDITISGYYSGYAAGRYSLRVELQGTDQGTTHLATEEVQLDADGSFPGVTVGVSAPVQEGSFRVAIKLIPRSYLPTMLVSDALVVRSMEFVALGTQPAEERIADWRTLTTVNALEASKPGFLAWMSPFVGVSRWPETVRFDPAIDPFEPTIAHGELSARGVRLAEAGDQQCLLLKPKSWLAVRLPKLQAGHPYRIKIRTPRDRPQRLIVSLKGVLLEEPAAASLGNDYEILTSIRDALACTGKDGASELRSSELMFWPMAATNYVLFANPDEHQPASVFDFTLEIAEFAPSTSLERPTAEPTLHSPERLVGVYIDKPLLSVLLGNRRTFDQTNRRFLESWETWQVACHRLEQYLDYLNANLLVMKVHSEGGALFPSAQLEPNLRFDAGTFFADGRNANLKDAVALLLKYFGRSQRKLVLSIEVDPNLATLNRLAQDETFTGFQTQLDTQRRQLDPLDPQVQSRLAALVEEIAGRYGTHEAFGGIHLQLDRTSPLLYRGDLWLPSQSVREAFALESGIEVPRDPSSYRAWLALAEGRKFLKWRAEQLTRFVQRLAGLMKPPGQSKSVPGLYIDVGRLWEQQPNSVDHLNPQSIIHNPREFLLNHGIDSASLVRLENVSVLQVRTWREPQGVNSADWIRSISRQLGLETYPESEVPERKAILDWQRPLSVELEGFDEFSLATKTSGSANVYPLRCEEPPFLRKAFLRQLAGDDQQVAALGAWLPMGADLEALRRCFRTLRELPSIPFEDVVLTQDQSAGQGPVTVRQANFEGRRYLQFVNAMPWPENVTIDLAATAPLDIRVLGERKVEPFSQSVSPEVQRLEIAIPPFDVVGIELNSLTEGIVKAARKCDARVEERISEELGRLEVILREAGDPTRQRRVAQVFGDFELANATASTELPQGWNVSSLPGVRVQRSNHFPHSGKSSLEILNENSGEVRAWIQSPHFAVPENGRLTVQAWLRCPTIQRDSVVHLRLIGLLRNGEKFEQGATFGSKTTANQQLPDDWGSRPATLHVSEIPIADVESLFVAIELVGQGKVWIDDVQVLNSWLHPSERTYLQGRLLVAKQALQAGDPSVAEQLLDSAWGRYLYSWHPRLAEAEILQSSQARRQSGSSESPTKTSWNTRPNFLQKIRDSVTERWRR